MKALNQLIQALRVLPNVGPKSAQRIAHQLLEQDRAGAQKLIVALQEALLLVHHCRLCNTFCEDELCELCADSARDPTRLMVVHMPVDVASMEAAHCHDGLYFVLMGHVSPTQDKDLNSLALEKLIARVAHAPVEEIIIATNFTAEGDATAFILAELFKNQPYRISRLARGMPLGAELEYIDSGTLAQAVFERRRLRSDET